MLKFPLCRVRQEVTFWFDLIEKYLKPLEKDPEKEKQMGNALKELRNQMVFSFLMINSIWVLTIFLLQENKDLVKTLGQCRPLCRSFHFKLCRKNRTLQQDLNMDFQSRRRAHWPLTSRTPFVEYLRSEFVFLEKPHISSLMSENVQNQLNCWPNSEHWS